MIKVTGVNKVVAHLKLSQLLLTSSIVDSLKLATPVDTGNARDGWHREGTTIVNDVPYITELNRGSSKQAPFHFVEKVLAKYK